MKKIVKITFIFLLFLTFFLGFAKIQVTQAAAPNLNTLYPVVYSSQTGTAWTTTTVGNIDEGIAGADGATITAGTNSTSSIFYSVTTTPSDFVKMTTLNYNIRYLIAPITNDTETLSIQVFKADKTTALTGKMLVTSTTTAINTFVNKGVTAFTGVSTTATKAEWDASFVNISTTHSAAQGADGSVWSIDAFEMTGTYQLPPTVALSTPTNGATSQSTTPTLNFTGTDVNSDAIDYNVQVDTANTFDSSTTTIASNNESTVDGSIDIYYGTPGQNVGGQTFTTSSSITLTSVKFYLKKSGSPTGSVPVQLYATSGGIPTGSVLATSNNLNISTLTTSYQLIEFTFSSPYTLSASTMYSLTLTPPGSGATDSANKIILGVDTSSPGYTGGTTLSYSINTTTTHASDSGFYVYSKSPLLSKFSVTSDATYYFDGNISITDPNSVWTNDANGFDGNVATYATITTDGSTSSNYLYGKGTNAPSSGNTITQVKARVGSWNSSTYQPYVTLSTPSGGWTWAVLQSLEVKYYWTSGAPGNAVAAIYTAGLAESLGQAGDNFQGNPGTCSRIEISVSYDSDATFTDITNGANTHPFPSAEQVGYTIQGEDALTAGATYFWRVAGIDPLGTNTYGVWSSTYSFTTGSLDHYLVMIATPQTAGVCATGTNSVTAQDVSNSTITSDTSTVNMTNSGTGVTFYTAGDCSSSTTSYTLSSGVANIYYKTDTAQSFTITATKASSTETGTSSSITVNAAGGATPTPSPSPTPNPSTAGEIKGGVEIKGGTEIQ